MTTMGPIKAIKTFFEADGGKPVSVAELKKLSKDDKEELSVLCAAQLGVQLEKAA